MADEISITLTCLSNNATETISVSRSSTTLAELCEFAVALLGLPSSAGLTLHRNGNHIFTNNPSLSPSPSPSPSVIVMNVGSAGIENGDLIVAMPPRNNAASSTSASASASAVAPAVASTPSSGGAVGGLGLDFSSLLGSSNAAQTNASSSSNYGGGGGGRGGGLTFNIPSSTPGMFTPAAPVQWDGMSLDDALSRNPNPEHFVQILLDQQRHPNMLKELNYHSPTLATKLKHAGAISIENAATIWRQEMQKNTMSSTLSQTMKLQQEQEMERRLRTNPMDIDANAYFGEKIKKQNVEDSYRQMMEEFPESMGRVLMLYVDAEVNGYYIQAFVDSGAQSTIMSSKCAEQCGLSHLIDTRFEGVAVGVGTGKILGRIHMAQMKIKDQFFPCTITVMDSEKGLGDKNMDFLLGLDMLKRFHCNIDLQRNVLVFSVGSDKMETPFLHEKDLAETKGGTKGFDADKSNMEIEKMREDREDSK